MNLKHLAAVAAAAALTLVAAPAHAQDNGLMNPNAPDTCYRFGEEVPTGTVATTPPGLPTTPDGHTPGMPPIYVNGVPAGNTYVCVNGDWVWVGVARRAQVLNQTEVTTPTTVAPSVATRP
jgi:hypothetical protein